MTKAAGDCYVCIGEKYDVGGKCFAVGVWCARLKWHVRALSKQYMFNDTIPFL